MNKTPFLLLPLLCTAAAAQSLRVVPNGYESLEGTSAARSPLGWTSSRIQYLVDGAQLCQTTAVITALRLRLDGGNFNVDAPVAKSFQATIDAYEVPSTPHTMSSDWLTNIGSATPTNVFSGTLNVPAANRQWPYPNPFTVDIQLSQPIVYQRANGNLMLDLTVTGGSGDNWPADGFFFHATEARGEVTSIWDDAACTTSSGSLSINVPQVQGNGVVGSTLEVQHTATPAAGASMPFVLHVLSIDNQQSGGAPLPIALGAFQAPACLWNVGLDLTSVVPGTATGQTWPLPVAPSVVGVAVFTQAVGLASPTSSFVPSDNAYQIRIGSSVPAPGPAQMVHRSNYTSQTTGSLSPTGYYGLVVGFVGAFQ
ncbi:MAG: hypothetical protein R3F29_03395 [Planctomycetota bacterium]